MFITPNLSSRKTNNKKESIKERGHSRTDTFCDVGLKDCIIRLYKDLKQKINKYSS